MRLAAHELLRVVKRRTKSYSVSDQLKQELFNLYQLICAQSVFAAVAVCPLRLNETTEVDIMELMPISVSFNSVFSSNSIEDCF